MTGAEVRSLCLSLPEVTEKETWGAAETAGHPTFRVKDEIFVILAVDGTGGSIKTSPAEQAHLLSAFPEAVRTAAYVGRFGWVEVDFESIPDTVLHDIIVGAWTRTAPKRLVAGWEAGR